MKWGAHRASSRWSSSLYCAMRDSDEMTIGTMHLTLDFRESVEQPQPDYGMPAVDDEPEYLDWDPFWWVEVEKERLEAEKECFTEVLWTEKVPFLINLVL